MIGTPFHSPVRVKRRRTPPKFPSAVRITSSDTPSSRTTAIAAVAVGALWRAGVGARGHRQRQAVDFGHRLAGAIAEHDREARAALGMVEIYKPHVGLRILAVGDHA